MTRSRLRGRRWCVDRQCAKIDAIETIAAAGQRNHIGRQARVQPTEQCLLPNFELAYTQAIERVEVEVTFGSSNCRCDNLVGVRVEQMHGSARNAAFAQLPMTIMIPIDKHAAIDRHPEAEGIGLNVRDFGVAANYV